MWISPWQGVIWKNYYSQNLITSTRITNYESAVKHTVDQYFTYILRPNSIMQEAVLRSAKEIQDKHEHKRRLLLNILKERGIFFDLETKKTIDDNTSLETLLRILQIEKGRERGIEHLEILDHVEQSPKMEMSSYESVYDSWDIAYKVYIAWLSHFISSIFLWWT
jgi:hypothetical protein